jgi:hypothetical protein
MVKVASNDVPGAVGQGRVSLLPGLEVPRVNWAGQFCQGFGSGAQSKLRGTVGGGCRCAVAGGLEHWIDSLWSSVL